MPESIIRKVGLISCSGEDLPEGTVSRIATRLVLEELRPMHTVTLCLPLFLAGGESERSFARRQPTITIDGCDKLCARRATMQHSGKPAASFIVSEFVDYRGLQPPAHRRVLDDHEMALARAMAEAIAAEVDTLVEAQRLRPDGVPIAAHGDEQEVGFADGAGEGLPTCACQSDGPPARTLVLASGTVLVVGLDAILAQFARDARPAGVATTQDMLALVKIYNAVPPDAEGEYAAALTGEYTRFLAQQENPA
jgi:hypothetical protein